MLTAEDYWFLSCTCFLIKSCQSLAFANSHIYGLLISAVVQTLPTVRSVRMAPHKHKWKHIFLQMPVLQWPSIHLRAPTTNPGVNPNCPLSLMTPASTAHPNSITSSSESELRTTFQLICFSWTTSPPTAQPWTLVTAVFAAFFSFLQTEEACFLLCMILLWWFSYPECLSSISVNIYSNLYKEN